MACLLGFLVAMAVASIQVPHDRLAAIEVHCVLITVTFLLVVGHNKLQRALLGLATNTHEHNRRSLWILLMLCWLTFLAFQVEQVSYSHRLSLRLPVVNIS